MLISKKYRFIFVHIYKNAGISITTALTPFAATPGQINLDNFLRKFGASYLYPLVIKDNSSPQEWVSNILNNLYERMTFLSQHPQPIYNHASASEIISKIGKETFNSYFSFGVVRNPWGWQVSLYHFGLESTLHPQRKLFRSFGSFETYLRWRCKDDVHFQKDFLFSKGDEQLVSFIGRYENLEMDFQKICKNIGIDAALPTLNQSLKRRQYQEYYTPDTIQLVRNAFAPDIELLGYDFE
jgi:hypothetical protein